MKRPRGPLTNTVNRSFSGVLKFDVPLTDYRQYVVDSNIVITIDTENESTGNGCIIILIGNGTNTPDLSALDLTESNYTFDNTSGTKNYLAVMKWGDKYVGNIFLTETGTLPDTTAPTLSTAVIADANADQLVLTFDEAVTLTNLGYTINTDGDSLTLDAVSGSGTDTITFTLNRNVLDSETLTLDYDSVTGDTVDTSDNPLVLFTAMAITNNVSNPALSSATIENASDDTVDLVFGEAVTITTAGWSVAASGGAVSINSVTGSGTTTPAFTLSRSITESETVTISYDSSTGATTDASANELADITNRAVTNNVTDLIVLTAPTLGAVTVDSSTQLTVAVTDNNTSPNEVNTSMYYRETGQTTWILHGTMAQDATSYAYTGLTASTGYDLSAIAEGDGTTTSDSVRSNVVTGTTSAPETVFDIASVGSIKLKLWLKDSRVTDNYIDATHTGYIEQWTDFSGNNNHATETTLENKLIVDAVNGANNDNGNRGAIASFNVNTVDGEITTYIVAKVPAGVNFTRIAEYNTTNQVIIQKEANTFRAYNYNSSSSVTAIGLLSVNALIACENDAVNTRVFINDNTLTEAALGACNSNQLAIAYNSIKTTGCVGNYLEVVVAQNLTATDKSNIINELNRRYNLYA